MVAKEHSDVRRMNYRISPHPFSQSKAHKAWISRLRAKRGKTYVEIEREIYAIDRLAYLVRHSKINVDLY